MGRKAKALTPSERKLFDLLVLALGQLQDNEAFLSQLIKREVYVDSECTGMHLRTISQVSIHLYEELRSLGLIPRKREPFEDNSPIWSTLGSSLKEP